MRLLVKRLASIILIPFFRWYLRKERSYRYKNISIKVFPGVFHPGFFYSTKFLLEFITGLQLTGKSFLELGCGTGLISIAAAKAGAVVASSDLSNAAIENTRLNVINHQVIVNVIKSDLFDHIDGIFDYVIVNPPYYAKPVSNEAELAWCCGENFEYFVKFFSQLPKHIHNSSTVIMVLTKGCDLTSILEIATKAQFSMEMLQEQEVFFDGTDYLFSIKAKSFV